MLGGLAIPLPPPPPRPRRHSQTQEPHTDWREALFQRVSPGFTSRSRGRHPPPPGLRTTCDGGCHPQAQGQPEQLFVANGSGRRAARTALGLSGRDMGANAGRGSQHAPRSLRAFFRRGYLLAQRTQIRITVDANITTPRRIKYFVRRREGGIPLTNDAVKVLKTT